MGTACVHRCRMVEGLILNHKAGFGATGTNWPKSQTVGFTAGLAYTGAGFILYTPHANLGRRHHAHRDGDPRRY